MLSAAFISAGLIKSIIKKMIVEMDFNVLMIINPFLMIIKLMIVEMVIIFLKVRNTQKFFFEIFGYVKVPGKRNTLLFTGSKKLAPRRS